MVSEIEPSWFSGGSSQFSVFSWQFSAGNPTSAVFDLHYKVFGSLRAAVFSPQSSISSSQLAVSKHIAAFC